MAIPKLRQWIEARVQDTGDTMTGHLIQTVDGNPYYGLNDGTNNWYFQAIKADGACYIGPTYTLATKIDTSGNMTVKGSLTVNGSLSGNASSATKLATARTIFGVGFDGTGNVVGKPQVYGSYTSTAANRYYQSGIEVRENGLVGSAQSDIGYAPSIGFHWGERIAATMLFHSDGNFYLKKQDGATRASLDANLIGNASTATKLATAQSFQINLASTSAASFDGSTGITPGVTGILSVSNGGTGQSTAQNAANAFLNALSTGSSTPTDNDYYISQYAGGGTTTTTYHRRPVSALWSYINGKVGANYLKLSGGTMTGVISKAGSSSSWINGRDKALVRLSSYSAYSAITSMKTTDGAWEMGVYANNNMWFTYTPDTNYSSGTNNGYVQIQISSTGALVVPINTDYTTYKARNIASNTSALTSGSSALSNGNIYLQYK